VKTLFFIFVTTTFILARFEMNPSMACEAYNNMKHTKNTHHVVLDPTHAYTVLRSHKGQKLLLIKGEQPSQRWVDEVCFNKTQIKGKETLSSMESELARLEKEMQKTLGTNKVKTHKSQSNSSLKAEKTLAMQNELAYLENKMHSTLGSHKKQKATSTQNLLALSWHNAFCETHRYKKECKRGFSSFFHADAHHEKQFVLHGLWPQPRSNVYCLNNKNIIAADKHKRWGTLPSLNLDKDTKEMLSKVMPGFKSQLHKHEWIKHGTCYGSDANSYFSDAISLLKQVNRSALGMYFSKNIGNKVSLKEIRNIADKAFGRGMGKRISIQCKHGLITELWLNIGAGNSDIKSVLKKAKPSYSRCKGGRIDKAGFGK